MKYIFFISCFVFLIAPVFVFAASVGDIAITEIAYDLKGADDGHEWVEIQNTTAAEIDLTGWKFSDGSNHILNAPPKNGGQGALTIPAGGYAVLADDAAVFLSDHPGFSGTVIDTVMSLNNTAATLAILDKDGATIDSVAYQKEWGANSNGLTLEKNGGWKESAQEGGTPASGAPNSVSSTSNPSATSTESVLAPPPQSSSGAPASLLTAEAGENIVARVGDDVFFDGSKSKGDGAPTFLWNFGDGATQEGQKVLHQYLFPGNYIVTLKISDGVSFAEDQLRTEIYPDSIAISEFLPSPADGEGEWIELANQSSYGVDISGWGLGAKDSKPDFKIPESTFLAGKGFLALSDITTKISLPDSGGVYLFYPNGQIAGKIEYKNAPKNNAAVLLADGRYEWSAEQTPGARNMSVSSASSNNNDGPSARVFDNIKETTQTQNKSSFVEYKKYDGIKSFIAEPAFAYTVGEAESVPSRNEGDGGLPGAASSYGAFSRLWFWALAAGGAVALFFVLRKRFSAK